MDTSHDSMGWNNRLGNSFPDPFMDYASTVMPKTITDTLKYCEYLAINNGIYSSAIDRVVSYFVTKIQCVEDDIGDEEREQWEDYYNQDLNILGVLKEYGRNRLSYGNVFVSLIVPFTRHIFCTKCGSEHPLRYVYDNRKTFGYQFSNYEFQAKCQNKQCVDHGVVKAWRHVDRRSSDCDELSVKFWSPHEIDILESPVTKRCTYIWRIPENDRRLIREGHIHVLEDTNWEIIECVKNNENLQFERGEIYHDKEPALAGHKTGGWGISRVLSNFRQAWYEEFGGRPTLWAEASWWTGMSTARRGWARV